MQRRNKTNIYLQLAIFVVHGLVKAPIMNNLVAFYLLKCLWPSMPSGSSLKRPRQAATATTGADLVSPGAQGSADLPTWHGGETVLDVAINELPLADDGQNAPLALVKWGDVPLCVRE